MIECEYCWFEVVFEVVLMYVVDDIDDVKLGCLIVVLVVFYVLGFDEFF